MTQVRQSGSIISHSVKNSPQHSPGYIHREFLNSQEEFSAPVSCSPINIRRSISGRNGKGEVRLRQKRGDTKRGARIISPVPNSPGKSPMRKNRQMKQNEGGVKETCKEEEAIKREVRGERLVVPGMS